jgi:hypothetical protein
MLNDQNDGSLEIVIIISITKNLEFLVYNESNSILLMTNLIQSYFKIED